MESLNHYFGALSHNTSQTTSHNDHVFDGDSLRAKMHSGRTAFPLQCGVVTCALTTGIWDFSDRSQNVLDRFPPVFSTEHLRWMLIPGVKWVIKNYCQMTLWNADSFRNKTNACLHEWDIKLFIQLICSKHWLIQKQKSNCLYEWDIKYITL